jgi:hypothetical protein
MLTTRMLVPAMAVAALLAWASPALAITYHTNITSPGNGVVLAYDNDNVSAPGNMITVTGTSDMLGLSVDILCFNGPGPSPYSQTLASSVPTDGSGNFSTGPIDWSGISSSLACVLRAVPAASVPAGQQPSDSSSTFRGPMLFGGYFQSSMISGSSVPANNGKVYNYFAQFAQTKGSGQYSSIGGCGLIGTFVYGPDFEQSSNGIFGCNAYVWAASMLKVDRVPTYNVRGAASRYFASAPCCPSNRDVVGVPNLTRTWSVDPATGNATIQETDPIVRYDAASGTYVPVPVQVQRTIFQDADGLRFTISDRVSSTDGQAHQLRLVYEDDFQSISGERPVFRFPWNMANPGYDPYAPGEVIPAAPWASTYFIKKSATRADNDPMNIHAAITFSSPPDSIAFGSGNYLYTTYTRTVPATGTLDLTMVYAAGFSDAQTSALVIGKQDAFSAPVVKFTAPADGSTVSNPNVTVTGTAVDNVGVNSFTLNGQAVPLAPDGTFSVPMTLSPGPNTLTAVAKDGAGNTTQQSETVTYTQPKDTTRPKLSVLLTRISLARLLGKGLPVTVSCDKPCDVLAQLLLDGKTAKKLRISRSVEIGTARGQLAAPGKTTLVIKLKPKARKGLRGAKSLKLTLTTTAADRSGNVSTDTKTVKVGRR